jgi:hypothetical protein
MKLDALQHSFRSAVTASDTAVESAVQPDALGASRRVSVYRNAVQSNWRSALANVYPVVLKLVGKSFFNEAADRYAEAHPSTSGDLHDYGGRFGDFLQTYAHASELKYLPDVARLEWAMHEAFHAEDVKPLQMAKLAAVAPEDYGNLQFAVAPWVRLIDTAWPILAIWEANQGDGDLPDDFDLHAGGDWLMVRRDGFECTIDWLEESDFQLLQACMAGATLAQAMDEPAIVELEDQSAYLLGALQRFVPTGVLYDFTLAESKD